MFDDARPIFLQLAEKLQDDILQGRYQEGAQVPSTNELAAFYRINPATAGKSLGILVDAEILIKKRGIGMFVAPNARAKVANTRDAEFVQHYVTPLLAEARLLGLTVPHILALIQKEAEQ